MRRFRLASKLLSLASVLARLVRAVLGIRLGGCSAIDHDTRRGCQLLLEALCEPAHHIVRNAGHKNSNEVIGKVLRHSGAWGYDSARGVYCDLYEAGIVDPAKVALVALLKAASIGALLLTTEALVCNIPEPKPTQPSNIPAVYRG